MKSLFTAYLADCVLEHFEIGEFFTLIGFGATMPIIKKPFVTEGTSLRTSIFSRALGSKGDMGISLRAPTLKNLGARTSKLGRFVGRWTGFLTPIFLAYDIWAISSCTKDCIEVDDDCHASQPNKN